MQYLIHIGVNKTGTSSLQRVLYDNRDILARHGIVYPETGIETAAHHNVARALKGVPHNQLGLPQDWIQQLQSECSQARLCILSSENLCTLQDPARMLALCPAGNTRVIVYVREHAAHIVSWYQQAVQSRNTALTIEEFVEHHALSFSDMIDGWITAYGKESVIVRLYDRSALLNGDIITDFCSLFDGDGADLLRGRTSSSNPSISGNLLFVKRVLNCFISKTESLLVANEVAGLASLDPTFSGKIPVGEDVLARIQFLCRHDRARLNERFLLNIVARKKPIRGALYPDLARLAADLDLIHSAARKKGLRISEYLDDMRASLSNY